MDRRTLWLIPSALAAIPGCFWLYYAIAELVDMFLDSDPAPGLRNEQIAGFAMALGLALPFWVAVTLFSLPARKAISRGWFLAVNAPSMVVVLLLVGGIAHDWLT